MIAGAEYGAMLLWAAVLGTVLKLALAEGVGRWHLASGSTLLDGWRRLGYWATVFFGGYIAIWGFVYGATAMSAVGLPLNALFGGLPVRYWAMIAGVVGLALVWMQRYHVFEKFMTVLVLIKFVSVVTVALLVTPNLGEAASSRDTQVGHRVTIAPPRPVPQVVPSWLTCRSLLRTRLVQRRLRESPIRSLRALAGARCGGSACWR